jgi:hypothetical protein
MFREETISKVLVQCPLEILFYNYTIAVHVAMP